MTLRNVVQNAAGTGLEPRRRPGRRSDIAVLFDADNIEQDTNAADGADVRSRYLGPVAYIRDGGRMYKNRQGSCPRLLSVRAALDRLKLTNPNVRICNEDSR